MIAAAQTVLDGRSVASANFLADALGHAVPLAAAGKVVGVEVLDVEEAVSAVAKVDEGGLNGAFNVGDFAEIDVADA